MKNLICFTTPVDFRQMKLFANFADRRYFDVDHLVDSVGNMPPELILVILRNAAAGLARRPARCNYGRTSGTTNSSNPFRMFDRWATNSTSSPLAGEYFRTITKDLMWDNKLLNDTMSVGGRPARARQESQVPILHAVAEHDHIVPYDAAKHLIAKVGSADKEEVIFEGGHVSFIAGPNAARRLWPKLDSWLGRRST